MPADLSIPLRSFEQRATTTLAIAARTETLWLTAPPTSAVRRQLTVEQLEALYESTYLRLFTHWEAFLEACAIRLMSRSFTPSYRPVAASGRALFASQSSAMAALLAEGRPAGKPRDYLLWHNPMGVADRVSKWLSASPIESVCKGRQSDLERAAAVRHHIAHGSADSGTKFRAAATQMAGSDFGGRPGRFLRADDISDPLNSPRWISRLSDTLLECARDVTT